MVVCVPLQRQAAHHGLVGCQSHQHSLTAPPTGRQQRVHQEDSPPEEEQSIPLSGLDSQAPLGTV